MKPVKVKIRDHEYLVKSEDDEEKAFRIAEYVNRKLKEVEEEAEGLSEKKAAILAALNIASDYFDLVKERDQEQGRINERAQALIKTIDSTLG